MKTMPALLKGRYELIETLGAGGEARVVKALDRQHERFVALKIRSVRDARAREGLLGEARILFAVAPHPALPLVREDFFEGDSYVVAMDWVDGTDLAKLVRDRGRPGLAPSSVLAYLAQAAEALTHLHSHEHPVIHGDVKPANLILTKGGQVKLVDFGLSSAPDAPRRRTGTPGFRAPELAADGEPSRASDVYGLAATAFALLVGSPPSGVLPSWDGIDAAQAEQLEGAIRLGLSTDPARRPAAPGELVERLRSGWAAALPTGLMTFCLSDIEGSTALWDSDPVAMAEALVRHDDLIAEQVESHGGRFLKSMGEGDSTVSVFDSAPEALDAALAATRALAAEPWPGDLQIAARFGVHTGEAERRGADYFGPTVNLAARLRGQADGRQIFVSSTSAELLHARLPPDCQLVDIGPHRLKGVRAPERIHAVTAPGIDAPLPVTDCPYRGLLAFGPADRDFFFGREDVVAELLDRLAPGQLVALVGASGSGKSSVLCAGLVAAAEAGEVAGIARVRVITPGADPWLDVDGSRAELVIVDQFEELFTLAGPDRRREFIDRLLGLPGPVVIGVRADLYGELSTHTRLARAVAENQILLGAMTDAELERAVTAPARLAGLRLEAGLVDVVLRDVAGEPGALPLMSHALRATWERRDGRTLTVEGYRESGGVGSAVAQTADAVVDELPEEQRLLVRGVVLRLTELREGIEDARRRATLDELVPAGASPKTVHALLERLADARLITLGAGTAEVAHEALIREWPTLRRWLDEDREGIRLHRQLGDATRMWAAGGRETSDLYRGARLAAAVDLARREDLNASERAFIDASVAQAEHERRRQMRSNRRLRGLLAGTATLLVLTAAAGALFFIQRSNARDAKATAETQALRSDAERVGALALSAPTLDQSLLFAVAGVQLEDRLETRGDLLAVLQANPAAIRVLRPSSTAVPALAISPEGRLLATGDVAGNVRFLDLRTWKPAGAEVRLPRPVGPQAMRFSPDGGTLAVGTRQGERSELYFIDMRGRRARRVGAWHGAVIDAPPATMTVAYSPDGRRVAVALATWPSTSSVPTAQRLMMLDARSGRTLWTRSYPFKPGQYEVRVGFMPSGRLLTSAGQAQTLVWDARHGRILRRFPLGGPFALSRDGRRLAVAVNSAFPGDPSARVSLIDLRSGRTRTLGSSLPEEWIESIAFTDDGERIVAAAFEGAHVWDLASGRITESFARGTGAADHALVIDPRGLVIAAGGDGTVGVWDPDGTRRLGRRLIFNTPDTGCAAIVCTVVNSQNSLLATTQGDGTVAVIDLRSLRLAHTLPAHDGPDANAVAFLPEGSSLITGGTAGTVTIWDLQKFAPVRTLRFSDPVTAVAVSPDGRLLAVQRQADGARDSHVEVRDFASNRHLYTHTVRFGVGSLEFTADGRALIASGCCRPSSTVVAWEARSGARRFERTVAEHATAVGLAPDSRLLGVGTQDGRVMLWDARDGKQRGPAIKAAGGSIVQVAFSPEGRRFGVGAFDGTASIWDVRSRNRVGGTFPVAAGVAPAVAFAPDGRFVLTELGDIVVWPTDRRTQQRFACQVAGRDMTRDEWHDLLPDRPYRSVCRT